MKLKVLIVDDEVIIAQELKSLLENVQSNWLITMCHNGIEALAIVEKYNIDIVFLDIHMPGINGLQVAKVLAEKAQPPLVVFVTAYSEHALSAFGVNAIDYILKPFDEQDIERVSHKIMRLSLNSGVPPVEAAMNRAYSRRFSLEGPDEFYVVAAENILYIQAKDRLVYVRTLDDNIYTGRFSLNEFEQRLDNAIFFRCHRNYIVNVERIQKVVTWFNRGYLLVLNNDKKTEIPVSRLYVRDLKNRLSL